MRTNRFTYDEQDAEYLLGHLKFGRDVGSSPDRRRPVESRAPTGRRSFDRLRRALASTAARVAKTGR